MSISLRFLAILCLAAGEASAQSDRAPQPYTSTLIHGAGLVTIPVAWISPGTGDFFLAVSGRAVRDAGIIPKPSGSRWEMTESVELHLAGRLSVGISLYDPTTMQVGAFGQVLLVQQPESGPKWLPSVAIGVRNLGSSKYQDRFVTGYERAVDAYGGVRGDTGVFNGSPTIFGVATRELHLEKFDLAGSIGYGTGLFKNDGLLGYRYNGVGTIVSGLFFGGRVVRTFGNGRRLTLMGENDGFDFNVGGIVSLGNFNIGLTASEVEERKITPPAGQLANFTKVGFLVSYNASFQGMLRGSKQRAGAAEANLALRRLEQEITQRRVITDRLVADLAKASQAADAAAVAERQRLVRQLEAEQAALKAAAERLEALTRKPPETR